MYRMFRSRSVRWRFPIRRSVDHMQKVTRRPVSVSCSSRVALLDWVFGGKECIPSAKRVSDSQELHGFVLTDEYNWLRDPNSKDVQKYINDENRYAEAVLEDTAFFQRQLIREMNHWRPLSHELESVPEQIDQHVYYIKSPPEGDHRLPVICRRSVFKSGSFGIPQIILNQNELRTKFPHVAVSNLKLSPSRKLAAFTLDSSGLETYSCHVTKVWEGPLDVMDVIPEAFNFEWGEDDSVLYYTTQDDLRRTDKLWKHKLGDDAANDILIYEEKNDRFFLDVSSTKDRKYITLNSNAKATSEVSLIDIIDHTFTHQPFYEREKGTEYYVEHRGKEFFILTNSGKSNYRVVRVDDSDPAKENWRDVLPHEENVFIDDMEVFKDYCVFYSRRLTSPRFSVVSLDDPDDVFNVQLPLDVCSLQPGSNQMFKTDTVRFTMSSPIVPPQVMEYNMSNGTMNEILPVLSKKPKYSNNDYECTRLEVPSKDGTLIPVTLFHHKHVKQNSTNPMLLHVYGSYGMNVDMTFSHERLTLLTRGWVVAFCHVRGGGELGREWYHQARLYNKHKSFEDFEACTKTLQDMGYSSPSLTAARGVSAGGLVVGAACNSSPDLYKAVILKVPFLDTLTSMLDSSLPLTSQEYDEWGDPRSNEDDFNNIKSYCPYFNISNQNYPSMLVSGSMHDERVPYWAPLKWVAKLRNEMQNHQEEQRDDNSVSSHVLCTIDDEGGHFGHGGSEGTQEEMAKEYAFLYKALGLPLK